MTAETSSSSVVVRADASPEIGVGHVMRCLAVAEVLAERGHPVLFAAARMTPTLMARVQHAGFEVAAVPGLPGSPDDLTATRRLAAAAAALILDGYHFGGVYRAALSQPPVPPVLTFDDTADLDSLYADVVVNPALQAETMGYAVRAPGATLLLGPRYAPLRREIRESAQQPPLPWPERQRVLVSFGGSDPAGLTGPCVARLLETLPGTVGIDAVAGGSNPRIDALRALAATLGPRVTLHIDTTDMSTLMRRAGMAVSAGGGTTGELAALAVPALLVIVADNQAPAAAAAAHAGIAVVDARNSAGSAATAIATEAAALWCDDARRYHLAETASRWVDGLGAVRIADALSARLG